MTLGLFHEVTYVWLRQTDARDEIVERYVRTT